MWYSEHGCDSALKAFQTSFDKLQLEYIDLYLIHWPGTNNDDPVTNKKLRKETWTSDLLILQLLSSDALWLCSALEKLVGEGKVRSIGVSNYTVDHLKELLEYCTIKPAVNQVELHPKLTQKPLIEYCNANGIVVEAYSSLAKGRV
jgi:diketogulonate reductase-like aldo/keto reductase